MQVLLLSIFNKCQKLPQSMQKGYIQLKYILPKAPKDIKNYYEPFVGGGAVYTSIDCRKYFINDKSDELISLYKNISWNNRVAFFNAIEEIIHNWDILTKVVENNYDFFVTTYKSFSHNEISEDVIKQRMFAFIIKNAEQFNWMFSETFNLICSGK